MTKVLEACARANEGSKSTQSARRKAEQREKEVRLTQQVDKHFGMFDSSAKIREKTPTQRNPLKVCVCVCLKRKEKKGKKNGFCAIEFKAVFRRQDFYCASHCIKLNLKYFLLFIIYRGLSRVFDSELLT